MISSGCHSFWRNDRLKPISQLFSGVILLGAMSNKPRTSDFSGSRPSRPNSISYVRGSIRSSHWHFELMEEEAGATSVSINPWEETRIEFKIAARKNSKR